MTQAEPPVVSRRVVVDAPITTAFAANDADLARRSDGTRRTNRQPEFHVLVESLIVRWSGPRARPRRR